jgi:hypothetical protein
MGYLDLRVSRSSQGNPLPAPRASLCCDRVDAALSWGSREFEARPAGADSGGEQEGGECLGSLSEAPAPPSNSCLGTLERRSYPADALARGVAIESLPDHIDAVITVWG